MFKRINKFDLVFDDFQYQMQNYKYKLDVERCNSCVLPRNTHNIRFDEDGICSICNRHLNKRFHTVMKDCRRQEHELDLHIERIKKRGTKKPYDCIVGVSGGRDSSYLLYLLVKKHKLRCLAAYYRTPFTPNIIDSNIRRIAKKLNVPLKEMDISREFHRKIARRMVLLWKKTQAPLFINIACSPCKLVNREVFRIAQENEVNTIIFGGNPYENFQFGSATSKLTQHLKKPHSFLSMAIAGIEDVAKGVGLLTKHSRDLWKFIPIGFQSSVMYRNPHTSYLRIRYPKIHGIDYFYYDEWKESELKKVLTELEWELPIDCNSTWRADCVFEELKNYMFYEAFNATHIDAFFSNRIRIGELGREQALKRLKSEGKISQKRFAAACKILELPVDFFHNYISAK